MKDREAANERWPVDHYAGTFSDERKNLIRLGNKLADAAERLEQNPLANCLPRFRYPVQDAVAEWRKAVDG